MKANALLLTCLVFFIATSCDDKGVTPYQPSETETQIIGNWLWLESCGGIDGNCEDSSGFGDDGISFGKDGSFFAWGTLIDPMDGIEYNIEQKTSFIFGPDTIVTTIVFKHKNVTFVDWIIKILDDNSLTVVRDCADCYESTYSRIRITDPTIAGPD